MTLEITSLESLRTRIAEWRRVGEIIGFVPTMGALHRGHLALVEEAKRHTNRVVVSIFVNPTQFGPNEDFNRYPRPLEQDLEQLNNVNTDAVWLPDVTTMYPNGFSTSIRIAGVTEPLEGKSRPGHFDGVATVVAKLFNQVQPDMAFFGEKDYQQLCLIKRLVNDLNMPISVMGVPTIREADGLALSSRNQYLDATQREAAATIYTTMQQVAIDIHKGVPSGEALNAGRTMLMQAGFTRIDYFELHDAADLSERDEPPARLLVAAWLGTTRLIDNIPL